MSFFGFDPTRPRDRGHASNAPGFGQHDAFAGLGSGAADDDAYVRRRLIVCASTDTTL
jgi:DNA topoisomerase 2-associated protein PAT1